MSKNLEDFLFKEMEKEKQEVQAVCSVFYPDGVLADFLFSSDKDIAKSLIAQSQAITTATSPDLTQEQLEEQCHLIQGNVKQGKADNIEVRLDQMAQLFEKKKHSLWKTALRINVWDDDVGSRCIFIKDDSTLDFRVFIGGENAVAIAATRNEEGEVRYTRLSEFHLLSFRENSDSQKEVGLVTSYIWLSAKIFTSVIFAYNLDPIKNLILSDWLQSEWQRAKEAGEQLSDEMPGGDANG